MNMYKPIYLIACVIALMVFCTSGAFAGVSGFNAGGSDRNWQTAGNWTAGIPTSSDTAVIAKNGADSAIINSSGAVCYNLYVGLSGWVTGTAGQLLMTGGSLDITGAATIGSDLPGIFSMSGGTVSSASGTYINQGGGSGTLEINGGTYTENAYLYFSNGGSNAHIKLYGGTLALNGGMQALNATGQIDITGTGMMIWTGDHVTVLNSYVTAGYIISSSPLNYGPLVTYDSVNGRTIVTSGSRSHVSVLNWTNTAGDNRWNTPGNWNVGGAVPYSDETAVISKPDANCIIDSSTVAACNNLYVGLSSYGTDGHLIMTGGSLNVANATIGYNLIGTFTMSGGDVTVTGETVFGDYSAPGGNGTLEITDGTFNTSSMTLPAYLSPGLVTTGLVKLYGGTLNITNSGATGFLMQYGTFHGTGSMDIKGTGKMTWAGDHTTVLTGYKNQGLIYTSDPRCAIDVTYDSGSNLTSVTVVTVPVPTCDQLAAAGLTNPVDMNNDCSVNFKDLETFASHWLSSSLN